ncbi:hypothetical protein ACP49_16180 [Clostridium botulinum]|uniref:phage tail family protein n=1 Tax=Clostridium botulinum TaxID=1491 RepID=UPI00015920C2|nr:phage tail family protein [Clostridium botulinum]ABS35234.1 conserved hypothetical protein [Clostridium botulinum A str. ATCC 19397]KOM97070.1 hypothetical protein ACP53_11355 [Clostridium botulinum]KOM99487.1 hypothetical protein ACP49_16180 [Clostridium botulinum]MBO3439668.1 phage tail family protein [Clostridium botulinum]MBY7004559.1 phage tail family protein [Clostridium botulinum]
MQKLIINTDRGQSITLGNSRPFILSKIDNTAGVKTNIITTKSPYQDGKNYHGTTLEDRVLPVTGAIISTSTEDLYRKRMNLCSIFNPKAKINITYINNAGEHSIECVVQDSPVFNKKTGLMQEFLVQLYCPSPFWQDIYETKEEVALWIGDFEFMLEIPDEGIEMGHRESNLIVNIFNDGDIECGMRIEFTALATVVNPSLFDINTRKYIKVKRSLQAGDKLIINTKFGDKTVEMIRSNGERQNVFNWIDLDSEFLQLNVGDNLFRYDAEQGIDNLEVAIYYKKNYLGV